MNRLIVATLAVVAAMIVSTGCLQVQVSKPHPPMDEQSHADQIADLEVRLNAAEQISSFSTRDEVLTAIATDAASLGSLELTRNAVQRISSFSARDRAIVSCAQLLKNGGKRAEALELAKLVSSFSTRDNLIKELAK